MCTQTAHTPENVNFGENGRNSPRPKPAKMCLLGVHTHTSLSEQEGLTLPQNTQKFHDLTHNARKDMIWAIFGAEIDTTFL